MKKNNFKIYIKLILDKLHLYKLLQRTILLNLRSSKQSSDFSKNGFRVFELVVKNINASNLEIWPTFGSLLGLVRNKKLLDYDNDLDFGCFFDPNKQEDLRKKLKCLGFKRVFSGYVDDSCVLDKFIFEKVETDFYYFFKEKDYIYSYDFEQDGFVSVQENIDIGKKIIPYKNEYSNFNLKLIELEKISFNIPNPINTHLIDLYGENYNIPDKNWHNNKRKNRHPIIDAKVIFENL